jgi:hypothetical protein
VTVTPTAAAAAAAAAVTPLVERCLAGIYVLKPLGEDATGMTETRFLCYPVS